MARQRGSSAGGNNTDATMAVGCCYAHYQFSPKFIMKTLANLKYYPENAFNEVRQLLLYIFIFHLTFSFKIQENIYL